MKKINKKGFTLIELIAVLVIMAILALIVTPLVMSIIRKAKISADKRSIDAYGRSIELAIAGYLLDNGTFPTSIEQLTIEYSGDEVVCSTTQLNDDSSVYLAGCTVARRNVDGYTYGTDNSPSYDAYSVGDEVTYNNVDYYVIKESGAKESTVTLLKAEPLTVDEVNLYGGVGTSNNHVNRYFYASKDTAYNMNGYGGMQYYSSSNCGETGSGWVDDGCTADYAESEIKYVVDAWANDKVGSYEEARLITINDLIDNLGYEYVEENSITEYRKTELTPAWAYGSNYSYWTSSQNPNKQSYVWDVVFNGNIGKISVNGNYDSGSIAIAVRPVITISKSTL